MPTLSQMTQIFYLLGIAAIILAGLLVVIAITEKILRRLAGSHISSTDLDSIGRKAVVTQTIRPGRPGKVHYQNASAQDIISEAVSDRVIRRGSKVLITAIDKSFFRVQLLPGESGEQSNRQRQEGK